mmetsp:Transcript_29190/g.62871  ORF Transcript_29190/g.62871 Transcript_29190/m.62871 type:complete len:483 (+) Transcript_29190:56-1504(+)
MFAFKLLAICLSFFLADKDGVGNAPWIAKSSWKVQAAQSTTPQRRKSSRQQQQQQRPMLHNQKHESAIRNIITPKFQPNSTPLTHGNHTSNVAIIVSSSRYWFNYRHVTNALSIYHLLKRGGMTDDNIVLMLADDIPCNMRNPFRGKIFSRGITAGDLMENVEIDYAGTDVTVDAFLRVLLGRHLPGEERKGGRSWPTLNENTNVLVYLTGHGGDNFFKFQDGEELMSNDVASAFSQMYELKRYNEILFISDTCQAFTMADEIGVPNVFSVGSSLKGQNSYASHSDTDVGQSVIDRYSKIIKDFVDDAVTLTSGSPSKNMMATNDMESFDEATVAVMERFNLHDALVRIPMNHGELGPNSKVGHADHLCSRRMNQVPLSDFFAASVVEREGQVDRRRVEASLWMDDWSIVADGEDSRHGNYDAEKECAIDREAADENVNQNREEQKESISQKSQKGMSPFSLKFLAMAGGFLLFVNFSSRRW